jgi:hypothetical protein
MRQRRTSGSMSGDGKRGVGHRPQATAPILDSTSSEELGHEPHVRVSSLNGRYLVPCRKAHSPTVTVEAIHGS